jgi:hypothetical protein
MHELQCPAPSEGGGLLRVLFLWNSEVPTDAGVGWLLRCCLALRRALRVPGEQERAIMRPQMTESEMAARLDAHDDLIRVCLDSRLGYGEFMFAYGDFPAELNEVTRSADGLLRLFGKRIAFHKLVAGVIAGPRMEGDSPGMDSGAGRFMPIVGLMRLRELVARHPDFRCT